MKRWRRLESVDRTNGRRKSARRATCASYLIVTLDFVIFFRWTKWAYLRVEVAQSNPRNASIERSKPAWVGTREPGTATAAGNAEVSSFPATIVGFRPFVLGGIESLLAQMDECRPYCAAGDRDSLASARISLLLALEEPAPRASPDWYGSQATSAENVFGKSTLGRAANTRRASEVGYRFLWSNCFQLHGSPPLGLHSNWSKLVAWTKNRNIYSVIAMPFTESNFRNELKLSALRKFSLLIVRRGKTRTQNASSVLFSANAWTMSSFLVPDTWSGSWLDTSTITTVWGHISPYLRTHPIEGRYKLPPAAELSN